MSICLTIWLVARVDDLEAAIALRRVELRLVGRRVDEPDAGVVDPAAVGGVVVLVRRVAGGEPADLLARERVEDVDDVPGRRRDGDARAVGRDRHVVGALAVDPEAPDDRAGVEVEPDHVGEARPRDDQQPAVLRAEHVVDELVVALADQLTDGEEVAEPLGVGEDLGHPLLDVGNDVEPRDARERRLARRPALLDHVGRAVPVVADEQDGSDLARAAPRLRETQTRGPRSPRGRTPRSRS